MNRWSEEAAADYHRSLDLTPERIPHSTLEDMIMYTTKGSVRGTCGHSHKTLHAAAECLRRDINGCASLKGGAYSDRDVVRTDGAPLTDDEQRYVDDVVNS